MHEGETIEEAVVRETKEEIGVDVQQSHLEEVGNLKFYFEGDSDSNQQMHIFFVKKRKGEPVESEEMAPQWYDKDKIPYEEMWVDDPHWLPKVIDGKKIEGEFHFMKNGSEIDKFELREI